MVDLSSTIKDIRQVTDTVRGVGNVARSVGRTAQDVGKAVGDVKGADDTARGVEAQNERRANDAEIGNRRSQRELNRQNEMGTGPQFQQGSQNRQQSNGSHYSPEMQDLFISAARGDTARVIAIAEKNFKGQDGKIYLESGSMALGNGTVSTRVGSPDAVFNSTEALISKLNNATLPALGLRPMPPVPTYAQQQQSNSFTPAPANVAPKEIAALLNVVQGIERLNGAQSPEARDAIVKTMKDQLKDSTYYFKDGISDISNKQNKPLGIAAGTTHTAADLIRTVSGQLGVSKEVEESLVKGFGASAGAPQKRVEAPAPEEKPTRTVEAPAPAKEAPKLAKTYDKVPEVKITPEQVKVLQEALIAKGGPEADAMKARGGADGKLGKATYAALEKAGLAGQDFTKVETTQLAGLVNKHPPATQVATAPEAPATTRSIGPREVAQSPERTAFLKEVSSSLGFGAGLSEDQIIKKTEEKFKGRDGMTADGKLDAKELAAVAKTMNKGGIEATVAKMNPKFEPALDALLAKEGITKSGQFVAENVAQNTSAPSVPNNAAGKSQEAVRGA
jgi:hypothetical protein